MGACRSHLDSLNLIAGIDHAVGGNFACAELLEHHVESTLGDVEHLHNQWVDLSALGLRDLLLLGLSWLDLFRFASRRLNKREAVPPAVSVTSDRTVPAINAIFLIVIILRTPCARASEFVAMALPPELVPPIMSDASFATTRAAVAEISDAELVAMDSPRPATPPNGPTAAGAAMPRRPSRSRRASRPRDRRLAHRAHGPFQPRRGVIVGKPFHVAKDDRRPVFYRQAANLVVHS